MATQSIRIETRSQIRRQKIVFRQKPHQMEPLWMWTTISNRNEKTGAKALSFWCRALRCLLDLATFGVSHSLHLQTAAEHFFCHTLWCFWSLDVRFTIWKWFWVNLAAKAASKCTISRQFFEAPATVNSLPFSWWALTMHRLWLSLVDIYSIRSNRHCRGWTADPNGLIVSMRPQTIGIWQSITMHQQQPRTIHREIPSNGSPVPNFILCEWKEIGI